MIGASLALKIAVPVLIATGGVVAIVAVPDSEPRVASAQLWIDSPVDAAQIGPGPVTVVAHAADGLSVDSFTLKVDGQAVATQTNLDTYDRLTAVQFTWTATGGEHFLVVSGGDQESEPVAVIVGAAGNLGTATPSPGATPSASPATPSPSASPSTAAPSPASTPTTSAPAPAPDPQVLSVTVDPTTVSGVDCTGTVTVTARVRNATGGSAQVIGEGVGSPVDNNIGGSVTGNTFTATFNQQDLTGNNLGGPYRVEVTVTNETGFDVGAASFEIACSKD